ncbi:flippase-like domain-containing protein [bacterium]|nr:flippase-like domain-containing protein [bacterium]
MKSDLSENAVSPGTSPEQMQFGNSSQPRSRWFFLFKLLVTLGIVALIFNKIQFTEIQAEFKDVIWLPLAAGMAMTVPNILIQYYKWRYLVHLLDRKISNSTIFTSLMCGFSIGLITPGRLGELGKGVFISSNSKSQLTGMAIIDKILSLWALSVLGVISLFYLIEFKFSFSLWSKSLFMIIAVLFVVLLLILVFQPSFLRTLIHLSKKMVARAPFREKIFSLISASDFFKKHHFMPSFYFSMIFQLIILFQLFLFINAFTGLTAVESFLAGASAMFVKSLLPIAVMDLGVREGAVIYFFGKYGIPASSAFNASIMLFLSNVLIPGIVGLYFFTKYNFFRRHEN